MTMRSLLAAFAGVALLSGGLALAQPTPPSPAPKATRSAKSIECSKQADAKGLHGKERRKFRRQCLRS